MAHDEAEEERTFLADLMPRTGRDLAVWMRAISEQGFNDKNDTIDWLRTQGFPFARASWLERIHSNGGRPIYLDGVPGPTDIAPATPDALADASVDAKPVAPSKPKLVLVRDDGEPKVESKIEPKPVVKPEAKPDASAAAGPTPGLDALIAGAKGYRPLYQMLEAAIRQAAPAVVLVPRATYIAFAAPHEFAAVQPTPSEIRLGLALGDRPHDANLGVVRIKGAPPRITHQITLKDARQINGELQGLILAAAARG